MFRAGRWLAVRLAISPSNDNCFCRCIDGFVGAYANSDGKGVSKSQTYSKIHGQAESARGNHILPINSLTSEVRMRTKRVEGPSC